MRWVAAVLLSVQCSDGTYPRRERTACTPFLIAKKLSLWAMVTHCQFE